MRGRIRRYLEYVESNRLKGAPYGRYVYRRGDDIPLAYCSVYGALARDLIGDLDTLSAEERAQWIEYINRYQCEDGLYRDPAFGLPDDLSDVPLRADSGWAGGIAGWGWWHMTNHIYCALDSLGAVAPRPLRLLEDFYAEKIIIEDWLAERHWDLAWSVSNEVLNLGAFLFYARDFHGVAQAGLLAERLLDWLDAHMDEETGYWGTDCSSSPFAKLQAMCGAYHHYILYDYAGRVIPRLERIVDTTLSLQNPSGGFALGGGGGACEDIDATFILVSTYSRSAYRREEIRAALAKVAPAILSHQNEDGGLVYLRGKPYLYGVARMSSDADQSCMFPTWFRMLSVALSAQVLNDHDVATIPWRFNKAPYVQFLAEQLPSQ